MQVGSIRDIRQRVEEVLGARGLSEERTRNRYRNRTIERATGRIRHDVHDLVGCGENTRLGECDRRNRISIASSLGLNSELRRIRVTHFSVATDIPVGDDRLCDVRLLENRIVVGVCNDVAAREATRRECRRLETYVSNDTSTCVREDRTSGCSRVVLGQETEIERGLRDAVACERTRNDIELGGGGNFDSGAIDRNERRVAVMPERILHRARCRVGRSVDDGLILPVTFRRTRVRDVDDDRIRSAVAHDDVEDGVGLVLSRLETSLLLNQLLHLDVVLRRTLLDRDDDLVASARIGHVADDRRNIVVLADTGNGVAGTRETVRKRIGARDRTNRSSCCDKRCAERRADLAHLTTAGGKPEIGGNALGTTAGAGVVAHSQRIAVIAWWNTPCLQTDAVSVESAVRAGDRSPLGKIYESPAERIDGVVISHVEIESSRHIGNHERTGRLAELVVELHLDVVDAERSPVVDAADERATVEPATLKVANRVGVALTDVGSIALVKRNELVAIRKTAREVDDEDVADKHPPIGVELEIALELTIRMFRRWCVRQSQVCEVPRPHPVGVENEVLMRPQVVFHVEDVEVHLDRFVVNVHDSRERGRTVRRNENLGPPSVLKRNADLGVGRNRHHDDGDQHQTESLKKPLGFHGVPLLSWVLH